MTADAFDDDAEELCREENAKRRLRQQMLAHPNPRDPDHPDLPEPEDGE